MARSSWKLPYINGDLLLDLERRNQMESLLTPEQRGSLMKFRQRGVHLAGKELIKQKGVLVTQDTSSTITGPMVGKLFAVYDGRHYQGLLVTAEMVGRKLGEFLVTVKQRNIAAKKTKMAKKKK